MDNSLPSSAYIVEHPESFTTYWEPDQMSDRSSDHPENISEPEQDETIGHTFVAQAMEDPTQPTPYIPALHINRLRLQMKCLESEPNQLQQSLKENTIMLNPFFNNMSNYECLSM